ncbi:hypothetical protein ACFP2F_11550 [Hymenobacter artigasi]|uniref:Tetratricopeptide repeat protein n=1 Tax=Hymenobacter artigasi TaxID=2719616 RepID=A0ABX1HH02_9BACT|nr:hypothetical protein [Hymenobacter artigasi]NKI89539.1 hypothetical protein [Hymenobacter artigasi]
MTRATLLHVLDRPTSLGPAEVRELEQLAQAFPYCQTAHLLLAKAAHDQGTMLASQRLRRAATYAADRSLLRRLIELVEPEPLPAAIATPEAAPAIESPAAAEPAPAAEVAPAILPQPVAPAAAEIAAPPLPAVVIEAIEVIPEPVAAPAPPPAPVVIEVTPEPVAAPAPPLAAIIPEVISEPVATAAEAQSSVAAPAAVDAEHSLTIAAPLPAAPAIPVAPAATIEVLPAVVAFIAPEPVPVIPEVPVAALPAIPESPSLGAKPEALIPLVEVIPVEPALVDLPLLVDLEEATIMVTTLAETVETPAALPAEALKLAEAADELPAQAPAIRPPVEVGEARFEFGLADASPVIAPTYQLPGLVDEWAASAVTRSLISSTALPLAALVPAAPVFTPAAFTGDAMVGYAFGESSRLGLSMQLLDLLIAKAEAAETSTAVVAAAQPPAVPLPPTGTFFEPDPLLLDHWATHCPVPPELPNKADLINNFLKRQPRLTRPGMLPPAPGGQPDLSVRSTRAEPDLVSENLARIFVRQGKTARAIEIYEKLMVKQPEKMAYFAAQIQSLQPSA